MYGARLRESQVDFHLPYKATKLRDGRDHLYELQIETAVVGQIRKCPGEQIAFASPLIPDMQRNLLWGGYRLREPQGPSFRIPASSRGPPRCREIFASREPGPCAPDPPK